MIMRSDDPVIDAMRNDEENEVWLAELPVCSVCGEPIQDDCFYNVFDSIVCESCINDMREYVDRYIEERRGL